MFPSPRTRSSRPTTPARQALSATSTPLRGCQRRRWGASMVDSKGSAAADPVAVHGPAVQPHGRTGAVPGPESRAGGGARRFAQRHQHGQPAPSASRAPRPRPTCPATGSLSRSGRVDRCGRFRNARLDTVHYADQPTPADHRLPDCHGASSRHLSITRRARPSQGPGATTI